MPLFQNAELWGGDYLKHTVQYEGETFALISQWYTGNAGNWRSIHAVNRKIPIKQLKVGDTIRIPEKLVARKSPMKRSFLAKALKKQPRKTEILVKDVSRPPVSITVTPAADSAPAKIEETPLRRVSDADDWLLGEDTDYQYPDQE